MKLSLSRLLVVVSAILVSTPMVQAAATFPDVAVSNAHYQAIQYLKDRLIINGYPDGLFRPDGIVTRAEILKIAANGAGIATDSFAGQNAVFPDVANNHPLKQYVNWAQTTGIVKGYSDGTFRPEAVVTRGEAAKILLKINNLTPDTPNNYYFLDVPQTLDLAPYIYFSVLKNLVNANGNRFGTGNGMKRGDVAEMMYLILIIKQNNYAPFGGTTQNSPSSVITATPTTAPVTHTISIQGFRFNPPGITIHVGDTLVWHNTDTAPHTITSQPGAPVAFTSGTLAPGGSFTYIFNQSGTYNYHCTFHTEMVGSVIVQ